MSTAASRRLALRTETRPVVSSALGLISLVIIVVLVLTGGGTVI